MESKREVRNTPAPMRPRTSGIVISVWSRKLGEFVAGQAVVQTLEDHSPGLVDLETFDPWVQRIDPSSGLGPWTSSPGRTQVRPCTPKWQTDGDRPLPHMQARSNTCHPTRGMRDMQEQLEEFICLTTSTCRTGDGQTVAELFRDHRHQVEFPISAAREGSGPVVRNRHGGSGIDKRSAKGSGSLSGAGPTSAGSAGHRPEHDAGSPGEAQPEPDLQDSVSALLNSVRRMTKAAPSSHSAQVGASTVGISTGGGKTDVASADRWGIDRAGI